MNHIYRRCIPRVETPYDTTEWRGLGAEPWWWRQCDEFARQAYADAFARRGQWKGPLSKEAAKSLRLLVTDPEGFGCRNLPHFAVALADLDCRVRVTEPAGYCEIRFGRITFPGQQGAYNGGFGRQTQRWETVVFEASGPDAAAALGVIRRTFEKGTENHLAVLRKYKRLSPEGAVFG